MKTKSKVPYSENMGVRETFRKNLKYFRKKLGLTQEGLSELCGCNLNYIAEIERSCGKFPKPETIDVIAAALGVKPSALFDEEGCPQNAASFNKELFAERIVSELGAILKSEMLGYLRDSGI